MKYNNRRINANLLEASICGTQAFKKGKKCIPASDAKLRVLIGRGENIKEPCLYMLQAWVDAWTNADSVTIK